MADRALSVEDAHTDSDTDSPIEYSRAQQRRPQLMEAWVQRRDTSATKKLHKLGFSEAEVAELEVRERVTLSRWLAPARGSVVFGASLFFFVGVPLVFFAAYRDSAQATDPALIWHEAYSTTILTAVSVLAVTVYSTLAAQLVVERWGDRDRSLGITCRRLLEASRPPKNADQPGWFLGTSYALVRRRRIIHNSDALLQRATRAGIRREALDALLDESKKEDGDPSPHVRALLRDHIRGLKQDTAVLATGGTRRLSDQERRRLNSITIALGIAASIVTAVLRGTG